MLPLRALLGLAIVAASFAGCVTSEVEPREDAGRGRLLNLATLVPGAEPGKETPAYYYWSGLLEGSWAAFKLDIPRDAVVTPPTGSPYAKIHVVTAAIENGEVVPPGEVRGGTLDPNAGAIGVIAYALDPNGNAFEGIGRINASFGAEYANWSIKGVAGAPVQEDTLLYVGAAPRLDQPGPVNVAILVRIGGPEPQGVERGSMWDVATRELASGREAIALKPDAQGGGFGASLYQEFVAPGRDADVLAREVTVKDRSTMPTVPGATAQRVLELSVRRSVDAPSRTILAAGQLASSSFGAYNWTYMSPGGETFSGEQGFGNVGMFGTLAGVVGLMTEPAGDFALDITIRTTAGALVQPLLALVTLGIDVEAVYGHPPISLDPGSGARLPGPVDEILRETAPP